MRAKVQLLTAILLIFILYSVHLAANVGQIVKIAGNQGLIVSCEEMKKYRDYCWSPSIEQLAEMENRFFPFVKKKFQGSGRKLRYPLFKYYRQYRGEKWRDINIIHIKGYYRLSNNDGWKTGIYEVLGGGEYYFTAIYDPSKKEFVEFLFNAPL